MSFDATRAVWAARDAGELDGGAVLAVALAMADRADRASGELVAGSRGLAARLGVSQGTAWRATRALVLAGVVEPAERASGTRATRWRFLLDPPSLTGSAHVGDNGTLRRATDTQANGQRRETEGQRRATDTLVTRGGNETSTTRITNDADGGGKPRPECVCGLPRGHRSPCSQALTEPAEISGRVATLRDAMAPPVGGGRLAPRGTGHRPPDDSAPFSHEGRP